jgi:hypothetical protein
LSYNHRKLAQNNAVVNQNKRNGPGGIRTHDLSRRTFIGFTLQTVVSCFSGSWGMEFFRQSSDRLDIMGAVIARAGVAIIYYTCQEKEREKPSGGEEVIQAPTPPPIMLAVFFAAAIAGIGGGD